MKAAVSEAMQAVFALIVAILIITLLVPRVGGPALEIYGENQALIIARSIAVSVNALAAMEKGQINKTLKGEWDIEIEKNEIKVSHKKFEGSETVLVEVKGEPIRSKRKILIIKEGPGKPIEIKGAT